jgi:hypothetical protein
MAEASHTYPDLPNVTADSWKHLLATKPTGVSATEWKQFCQTFAQLTAGRALPSTQIKSAQEIATKANSSDRVKKYLDDAYTDALENETTVDGRNRIASESKVAYVKASSGSTPSKEREGVASAPSPKPVSSPAMAPSRSAPSATSPAPIALAQRPVAPPQPRVPPGMAPDEQTAYLRVLSAVRAGKGRTYTYGKLNFAYEIANRASDLDAKAAIAADMKKLRPYAPGPGRYGVSDKEYKNYEMVEKSLGDSEAVQPSQSALVAAYKTAKKYGHTEMAAGIATKLPPDFEKSLAPVATATAVTVATKPGASSAASGVSALGPRPPEIDEDWWKDAPAKPANVPLDEWRNYLVVNYQLTKTGVVPSRDSLLSAAKVADVRGVKNGTMIFKTLAKGDAATPSELSLALKTSLAGKAPQKITAGIFADRLVLVASHTNDLGDLRLAEAGARSVGKTQTAMALQQRIAEATPRPAPAPVAIAAPTPTVSTPKRQGSPAPIPFAPVVAAAVPVTPKAKAVSDSARSLGVPAPVVAQIVIEAKKGNPQARQIVEQGQVARTAAADGDVAAQQQIASWRQAAPTNPEAQQALAGVAAASAIEASRGAMSRPLATMAPPPPPMEIPNAPQETALAPVAVSPPSPSPTPSAIATVTTTPSADVVAAAAAGAGVAPSAVAATILAAKKGDKHARKNMEAGAALSNGLANDDPGAVEEMAKIKEKARQGDKNAETALTAVAAAAATQKAMVAGHREMEIPEASVAGSGGGTAIAVGVGVIGIGAIGALAFAKGGKIKSSKK